jgi:uncharacterized protein (TIGR02996 family)
MAVYFACRSPYHPPGGKHLKRFDDDTVLDWFRARWHSLAGTNQDVVYERVDCELGCDVYSFPDLFVRIAEGNLPPPTNAEQLRDCLGAVYANEVLCDSTHLIQVETDDDEVGLSYCWFDDHYLARHRKQAAFLLNEDWKLPGGCGSGCFRANELTTKEKPKGRGEGKVWCVDLDHVGFMDELSPAYRLEGVRLPDLARHLLCSPLNEDSRWPLERLYALFLIERPRANALEKAFLEDLRQSPGNDAAWNAYSDWLQERGEPPAGLSLLHQALGRLGVWSDEGIRGDERDVVIAHEELGYNLPTIHKKMRPITRVLDRRLPKAEVHVHVDEHLAQVCFRADHWESVGRSIYHQLIFFDDLWASAHPDLANAILRYVRRWDVLSTSRTPPRD